MFYNMDSNCSWSILLQPKPPHVAFSIVCVVSSVWLHTNDFPPSHCMEHLKSVAMPSPLVYQFLVATLLPSASQVLIATLPPPDFLLLLQHSFLQPLMITPSFGLLCSHCNTPVLQLITLIATPPPPYFPALVATLFSSASHVLVATLLPLASYVLVATPPSSSLSCSRCNTPSVCRSGPCNWKKTKNQTGPD